ncbi:hypothetical protein JR316_0008371 [Psilocybe cubensis]|uniref:Uncharacterized protein n=1 Tax=Psilocybe cubensis TaxID=181762 RepID=A0ACB8GW25_PSICU|nr:hypothetical protein JR316_0008371 [Psilocybe cubensis]KAH9479776.1 hypothetical protein JR316_0008371 [Psilocybe cubensis]
MIFPFSFRFAIPGLFNPFAVPQQPPPTTQPATANRDSLRAAALRIQQSPTSRIIAGSQEPYQYPAAPAYPSSSSSSSSIPLPTNNNRRISRSQLPKIPRRHHSPDTTPTTLRALPLSRKRGWEPTFGAESLASSTGSLNSTGKASSTTSLSFTSPEGYLDTPARYREMMEGDMDMRMSDERRFAQGEFCFALSGCLGRDAELRSPSPFSITFQQPNAVLCESKDQAQAAACALTAARADRRVFAHALSFFVLFISFAFNVDAALD